MNKIIEEALTNMIRRIEKLEDQMSRLSVPDKRGFHPTKKESKPGMISQGQIDFIQGLERDLGMQGESEYAEMTLREASDYINKLKAMKEKNNQQESKKRTEPGAGDGMQPVEQSKPLTKKEIEEIGEEALL